MKENKVSHELSTMNHQYYDNIINQYMAKIKFRIWFQ